MTMVREFPSASKIITVKLMWECHGIKKSSDVKLWWTSGEQGGFSIETDFEVRRPLTGRSKSLYTKRTGAHGQWRSCTWGQKKNSDMLHKSPHFTS